MPVKVVKKGGKFRIVESNTGRIAKNKGGTAVGKGSSSRAKPQAQASAINISQARKRGAKIPRK